MSWLSSFVEYLAHSRHDCRDLELSAWLFASQSVTAVSAIFCLEALTTEPREGTSGKTNFSNLDFYFLPVQVSLNGTL
ncbi:MAG: hypothetical protein P2A85_20780 [Microcoleus anatoxicus]|uniref:Uncharacterized protein n=1 Tax=Microcoleus anatoxicus PTRS2 TaxID=2705321 RepID=A0ABU8YJB8_9CYAN